ncbi:MAG: flagellar biosynthesis protein FliR [Paenibacillaceae bacterium]|jgi:flagellar biosynthetic protein FliR|nr:flagellar biosynthesis protein FliR [Paenibacillaceae bacterium]
METILLSFSGFLLIFCRITAFFVVAPVFSSRNVPATFKIGLSAFIAFLIFSGLGVQQVPMDAVYLISIIKEIAVGLLLGFIGYLFFTVIQISGAFIDMQMGLSMANIIDPLTGASSPVTGNLKFMVAIVLFLSFNGHHMLLQAIVQSYDWVPLQNDVFTRMYSGNMSDFMIRTFTDSFALAFKMAAPLAAALFLTDVGLGILARTAPQFNIFVVGVPLKIVVGLILLAFLFPDMMGLFQNLFQALFEAMQKAIMLLSNPTQ